MATNVQVKSLKTRADSVRETREERLARARAALDTAEHKAARWGGSIDRTALRSTSPQPELSGPTGLVPAPEDRTDVEAPEHTQAPHPAPTPAPHDLPDADAPDGHARLALPDALAPLVPYGSLRAGSSVALTGTAATSLLLSLAASATGEDGWCAIAGMPDIGLRAAQDAGLDLARLALAPAISTEQNPQLPQVLSALSDGVSVLALGPRLQLNPALWRSLQSRARSHDTLVLAATPPGRADLHLEATGGSWQGLTRGGGRLRTRALHVTSRGRGIAGSREVRVLLPEVHGLIAPAATPSAPSRHLQAVRRAG